MVSFLPTPEKQLKNCRRSSDISFKSRVYTKLGGTADTIRPLTEDGFLLPGKFIY